MQLGALKAGFRGYGIGLGELLWEAWTCVLYLQIERVLSTAQRRHWDNYSDTEVAIFELCNFWVTQSLINRGTSTSLKNERIMLRQV